MEVQVLRIEPEIQPMQEDFRGDIDEVRLKEIIEKGKFDFNGWTSLVSEVESLFHDDIEKICLVYDSFLSEFPLCYGYWRRYADHLKGLSTVDKVVEIFERAVDSATYSVNVWDDYCSFSISAFEDPNDIRRLFKRAMSFVGKDYLCHTLWDKYIAFEFSQQQWGSLAQVYIQTLEFPSKKLHHFYESFKKLTAAWEEEFECLSVSSELDSSLDKEVPKDFTLDEITSIIEDLMDPSVSLAGSKALQKYISIGKQLYEEACQLDEKIQSFESHIRRPYFHPKSLDAGQLDNWNDYLNFVEMHGDFDWAVKLYERCLIPCSNYPEFWMRYVDFMETKGGREISDFALARATQTFLKRCPVIHLFSARYKEKLGDISGAHNAFLQYDALADSNFVKSVIMKANLEKRMGNYLAASGIYREAIDVTAAKNNLNDFPLLYLHFARLQYMVTNNKDSAREILVDGIKRVPNSKLLLEELLRFSIVHGETRHIKAIYSIVTNSISLRSESSQGLDAKDAEDIACLYLEYVDLCGTVDDIKRAWNWYVKLFPESMRSSSYEFPETGWKPFRLVTARRQEDLAPSLHQPCGDSSSGIPTNLTSLDVNMEQCENGDILPDRSPLDELSNQKRSSPANHAVSDPSKSNGEVEEGLHSGAQDVCPEVLKEPHEDATNANNRMKNVCPDVIHKPHEGAVDTNNFSLDLVPDIPKEIEASQTSKESLEDTNDKEEHDFLLEKDVNPNNVSVERLSLDDQDNRSLDSMSASTREHEASQETRFSNEVVVKSEPLQETSMSSGSMFDARQNTDRAQCDASTSSGWAYDSSHIHMGIGSLSLATHQKLLRKESPLQREKLISSSSNQNHRETEHGFQGHSHKNLHQREQQSPHQPYPQAEAATQMPASQGYPSTAMWSYGHNAYSAPYANMTGAQASSMQNMQQQSYDPSQAYSSQPTVYPQAPMLTYSMQMNEQAGAMQSNQAYNQMWQYYYYQQQYLWQQQQQLLNMQQQNQDPQQQQQQLLQTQQYYLEQQQQLANQQMQLQQFQQQLQFMQQQPYNQQPLQSQQNQQYLQQQQQFQEQNHLYMQQHQFQMQNMQQQPTPIQVQQQHPPLVKQEQEQEQKQQKGEDSHMVDPDTERLKKTAVPH